ncbi:MAG: hypothetical protein SP4CHLAM5_10070 [Chlamydiia bacterium]|nr:hypothetical protein [Chlamydiia bacterium]MCH9618864.1 hypothetical protein [Chlamydiia bacterium]MCH9624535.1 hypothetical protein [Chlamydiia bacterium]
MSATIGSQDANAVTMNIIEAMEKDGAAVTQELCKPIKAPEKQNEPDDKIRGIAHGIFKETASLPASTSLKDWYTCKTSKLMKRVYLNPHKKQSKQDERKKETPVKCMEAFVGYMSKLRKGQLERFDPNGLLAKNFPQLTHRYLEVIPPPPPPKGPSKTPQKQQQQLRKIPEAAIVNLSHLIAQVKEVISEQKTKEANRKKALEEERVEAEGAAKAKAQRAEKLEAAKANQQKIDAKIYGFAAKVADNLSNFPPKDGLKKYYAIATSNLMEEVYGSAPPKTANLEKKTRVKCMKYFVTYLRILRQKEIDSPSWPHLLQSKYSRLVRSYLHVMQLPKKGKLKAIPEGAIVNFTDLLNHTPEARKLIEKKQKEVDADVAHIDESKEVKHLENVKLLYESFEQLLFRFIRGFRKWEPLQQHITSNKKQNKESINMLYCQMYSSQKRVQAQKPITKYLEELRSKAPENDSSIAYRIYDLTISLAQRELTDLKPSEVRMFNLRDYVNSLVLITTFNGWDERFQKEVANFLEFARQKNFKELQGIFSRLSTLKNLDETTLQDIDNLTVFLKPYSANDSIVKQINSIIENPELQGVKGVLGGLRGCLIHQKAFLRSIGGGQGGGGGGGSGE